MKPKKILLVGPTSNKEMAEVKWLAPPIGVLRMAGFLNANKHYAEYYDSNLHIVSGKGKSFEEKLKEKKWDIIGFSILEDSLLNDITNMYLAKKLCPGALLVAGGIEAQFNYQTILDKSPCKIVLIGEGEFPILRIANGDPIEKIPGIVFRRNAVALTKEQFWDITKNIEWEKINYEDYWDFYMEKYKDDLNEERLDQIHTLRIFTRNRCPSRCKFCASTNQLGSACEEFVPIIDVMADQDLIGLLEMIKKAHPRLRTIYFTDDDFCMNPTKVIEFCKNVIKKELGLKFIAFSRVNELREDVLKWMAKAGFRVLNIGVESFSQNVLDEFSKKYDASIIDDRVRLVRKYGITPFVSIILISPNCSLDDIEYTIKNIKPLVADGTVVSSIALACIPYKGTDFYEETFDYMTEILKIPNTQHKIKRHYMILANDPYVREVQLRFYYGINEEIEKMKKRKWVKQAKSLDQAMTRLEFMESLIDDVRKKYHIKKGERGNPKVGRLTAAQASKGRGDKYQGI